jgi:hypothetical protein
MLLRSTETTVMRNAEHRSRASLSVETIIEPYDRKIAAWSKLKQK